MSFDPEKITFFAKTDARGKDTPFGIKAKDRQRHMYVIGKTGMGKSTLLENMAIQDIQNGEGMAFIDPHGSAAEKLLEYVPEHRVKDVIYFAPFDLDNPIAFNVMEDVGPDKRHLVVSGLMSTFKKIWVDAWSARMEYILTNALLVLIEYPETTLLSVNRLFNDKSYRQRVVDYCKDPAVKSYWVDEFANYTERFAADALPAIQNKIGQFTGNPLIRNIIGQPHSSFDIRKVMDEKKILIMNLSKGLVGETNASLLGSMLTTRIYLGAMSRADLPVSVMKTMPNFYFYVDEFQSFSNATFANILSEARKYHLNLIIAHQYIEQMEEEVRDAVFGNVGTTVSFRVGPFDAETLETVFTPRFLAADLVNLGFAQIYLTLMIDGIGSQPFSAVTLGPIPPPRISCKNMVIAASRKAFTTPRIDVEKIITDLHAPTPAPERVPSESNRKPFPPRTTTPPRPDKVEVMHVPVRESRPPYEKKPVSATAPRVPKEIVRDTTPKDTVLPVPKEAVRLDESVRSPQQNQTRTQTSAQPKKVEDLKSILSKIASEGSANKNSIPAAGNRQNHSQTPVPGKGVADSKQLKAALASALNPLAQPTVHQETVPDIKTEEHDSVPVTKQPVEFHQETLETVQPTPESVPSVELGTDDTQSAQMSEPSSDIDEKAALAALLAEAESVFDQNVEISKTGPDKKQIEKIFKSASDRSPFA